MKKLIVIIMIMIMVLSACSQKKSAYEGNDMSTSEGAEKDAGSSKNYSTKNK